MTNHQLYLLEIRQTDDIYAYTRVASHGFHFHFCPKPPRAAPRIRVVATREAPDGSILERLITLGLE